MSIIRHSIGTQVVAIVVGALMVVSLVGVFATPAGAQTSNDATIAALLAQIQALQAQLVALQGGSSVGAYVFTRDLTIGSTGADVTALQQWLIGKGYSIPAGATGYFGLQTQAAVSAFQAANGIMPTAGYFGPITRAKVNGMMGTTGTGTTGTTGTTGSTGVLVGGAGSISDADFLSSLSNEDVGEGANDVAVAGLRVEADDGSDILLTAVRLVFNEGTADSDFDKYADEVSLWFNGTEVARSDASNFDEDNAWSQTLSLSGSSIIKAGVTGDLVAKVSGISNIDSGDVDETWTVEFNSVRFRDAQGSSITESAQGDIGGATRSFSFTSFASSASSELKISANNDAVNDAHIIQVHATDEGVSDNIKLLAFSLEAKGTSDLEVKDFGVNVDVTGAAHVDYVIVGSSSPAIRMMINGQSYGTAKYFDDEVAGAGDGLQVGTDEDVIFQDVDYTIPAGTKVNVIIEADIMAVDTTLDIADTIQVQVGETETDQVALVDVRDESGTQITTSTNDADITGSATSGAHPFYEVGINVALVSATASLNADGAGGDDDDVGVFTMVFDVTAFGGTVYVGDTAIATTDADGSIGTAITDGVYYRVYDSGTATTDDLSDLLTFTTPVGVTDSTDNIAITEGATSRVTVTVTQTNNDASDDGIYYVDLAAIAWGIADDTTYEYNYIYNIDDYQTPTIQVN